MNANDDAAHLASSPTPPRPCRPSSPGPWPAGSGDMAAGWAPASSTWLRTRTAGRGPHRIGTRGSRASRSSRPAAPSQRAAASSSLQATPWAAILNAYLTALGLSSLHRSVNSSAPTGELSTLPHRRSSLPHKLTGAYRPPATQNGANRKHSGCDVLRFAEVVLECASLLRASLRPIKQGFPPLHHRIRYSRPVGLWRTCQALPKASEEDLAEALRLSPDASSVAPSLLMPIRKTSC